MMGKKTLSEIRKEIKEAFARSGINSDEWLTEQIRKLECKPSANPNETEILKQVRDALKKAVDSKPRKKPRRRLMSR